MSQACSELQVFVDITHICPGLVRPRGASFGIVQVRPGCLPQVVLMSSVVNCVSLNLNQLGP